MNTAEIAQSQAISPPSKPEPPQEVQDQLGSWMHSRKELSFLYARSMGGFIQTGRAALSGMGSGYLELRSAGTTIIVVTRAAKYSTEPQIFFSPSFSSARAVAGVSISLENWLY